MGEAKYLGLTANKLARIASDLDTENAKLRELVVEVFNCAKRGDACEICKVYNDGYACVHIMHELGIEVDE